MFCVSSGFINSQVILPLSYTVSQINGFRPRRTRVSNAVHAQNKQEASGLCASGTVGETTQNIQDIKEILGLNKVEISYISEMIKYNALYGYTQQMHSFQQTRHYSQLFGRKSSWHESHVSFNSFNENKNGYSLSYSVLQDVLSKNKFTFYGGPILSGARGFKTKQSIERKILKEASITSRLKFGSKLPEKPKKLDGDLKPKFDQLLNEETTVEAQRNLKVAFAEGYVAADPKKQTSRFMKFVQNFQSVVGFLVLITLFVILWGNVGGSIFRMHVGNGSEVNPEDINVSFDDVLGVEEAKEELEEIIQFLKNPDKFTSLGAELPKGVLLVGPPGTGKTLLARAVAGEAGVPFFHAAGPEFDEVLVGQGAKRVRDLFSAAKSRAPCVIFIDEIDSVGAKRTNSVLHPYANQTINQLLAEMDGFHKNEGVIVLGATNRRDDLDKALLRPGRFDVEVLVPVPDLAGRTDIFKYYLSKVKYGNDVEVDVLGRGTTGFTGADIKNVVNQAALKAASEQLEVVGMMQLEEARDKVLMGPEKKSRIPDEEANLLTAYHEGGHAIVAHFTKDCTPLHKVTIMPRGPSLGHTAYIPAKEQYHLTRSQMLAMMDSLMGGRAAEEIIFGVELITTGASSDLNQATGIATQMVKDLGMSDKVGLRTFSENPNQLVQTDTLSVSTKEAIDGEIRKILQDSYERAKLILKTHSKEHKALAEALMKYETLDAKDIKAILEGRAVSKVGY